MFNWISPEQFHLIYREITGDDTAPDTKQQVKFDLRMETIMQNLSSSFCKDLQTYSAPKSKYDEFWDTAAAKIKEMTKGDNLRHATVSMETGNVVVNLALAIYAPDLCTKCCQKTKKAGLTAKEMLSLSCLRKNNTLISKFHFTQQ